MRILVTGGAGYLGSVLVPKLLARGHEVRVLDLGYFGIGHLHRIRPACEIIREDIARLALQEGGFDPLLEDCQCVAHLAAISNDPSAELNPRLTHDVNYTATCALGKAAKSHGIRFVYSSTCSVYGNAAERLDEEGPVNPLTVYAQSKLQSEQYLLDIASDRWRPIILRNGTLFGHSARMRFDLVVNIFALCCALYNSVKVFGPGTQWRPFLHVNDCARAFVHFSEIEQPQHEIYNITHENLRVIDVAKIFETINPKLRIEHLNRSDDDERDYRVATTRMRDDGFRTRTGVQAGAEALVERLISGQIPDPESIFYRNAKWLREFSQLSDRPAKEILGIIESMSGLVRSAYAPAAHVLDGSRLGATLSTPSTIPG